MKKYGGREATHVCQFFRSSQTLLDELIDFWCC
jgi:hypothetical protein